MIHFREIRPHILDLSTGQLFDSDGNLIEPAAEPANPKEKKQPQGSMKKAELNLK